MKNLILNLALLLFLQLSLSGCMDDLDFLDFSGYGSSGGYNWGTPNGYDPYAATFYIDSTEQLSDSTATIWAHMQYDSILILEKRTIECRDSNLILVNLDIQAQSDTIDFRMLPDSILNWEGRYEGIYKYKVQVDSLILNTDYTVGITNYFIEKNIFKSVSQLVNIRLE